MFDELNRPEVTGIQQLWPHQIEVLDRYFDDLRQNRALGIELPTGSGKTLIGLLILEWARRQGKRVAVLTSSKALAADVAAKAEALQIPTVVVTGTRGLSDEEFRERSLDLRQYKRKLAIGVMNYWAYLYGTFEPPDLLVVDDAHSFENAAQSLFTVDIDADEDKGLYDDLVSDLKQRYGVYQRLEPIQLGVASPETYETIYSPHILPEIPRIRTHFHGLRALGKRNWGGERNIDRLHTYMMFVTKDAVTLTPVVPPMESEEKMRSVGSIVYMSATLGSPEVLQKSVGSPRPIAVIRDSDLKHPVGTMGTRLIFPLRLDADSAYLSERLLTAITRLLNEFGKAIVFATSKSQREEIGKTLARNGITAFHYNTEADAEQFSRTEKGALITAGRYVGLDIPSKICQVGIIARVPYSVSPLDSFMSDHLQALDYSNQKVAHRLVQALGRCNRSRTDRAIYFVLDGRLEAEIDGEERLLPYFPREIWGQLELGYDLSKRTLDGAIEVGHRFLDNNLPQYSDELTKVISTLPAQSAYGGAPPAPVLTEIKGWDELIQRLNYYDAGAIFDSCASDWERDKSRGDELDPRTAWFSYWSSACNYLQLKLQSGGPEVRTRCTRSLELAIARGETSWFKGLRVLLNELQERLPDPGLIEDSASMYFGERLLRAWEEFRTENTKRKSQRTPTLRLQEMAETLQKGTHDQIVGVAEELFLLMGFDVQNTSGKKGEPDLLLFATNTSKRFIVMVEVKSIEQGQTVSKGDIDQANGRTEHYRGRFGGGGTQVFPLLLTNKKSDDPLATENATRTCRILGPDSGVQLVRGLQRLIEASVSLPNEAVARSMFLAKVPSLEVLRQLLAPSETPRVSIDEIARLFGTD